MGVPFGLSVKSRTFGTLGFSPKKVLRFELVISIEFECKCLAAIFCIFSTLNSSYSKWKKYRIGDNRNGNTRVYFHSWEYSDSFLLTQNRILLTINSSNSKNSSILIGPFVHFGNKVSWAPIYTLNSNSYLIICSNEPQKHNVYFACIWKPGHWSLEELSSSRNSSWSCRLVFVESPHTNTTTLWGFSYVYYYNL